MALTAPAASAQTDTGRLADFTLRLSSTAPASPTGLTAHVAFHRADDPDAKPSPLRSAVLFLPQGLRIDTTALPECTASDDELRALGSEACPDDTRLTVGAFSAMTGFPNDPFLGDLHIFNGPSQIIEVVTAKGAPASPGFDRLTIEGTVLTAHPPHAPGAPPDNEASVRSLDYEIPVRVAGGKSLITTPRGCPVSDRWTSVGAFGFADGSEQRVTTHTPCRSLEPRHMRLRVHPKTMPAGRFVRLRFRVRSASLRCVRGATVLLRGKSARTNRNGVARIRTRFHAPGPRRARVTKPGCRSAHAVVRVLPAG